MLYDYRVCQWRAGLGFEAGAESRGSDYDDLEPERTEDLLTLRLGVSRMLGDDWQILAEYLHATNDASDSSFGYSRSRLLVALTRVF